MRMRHPAPKKLAVLRMATCRLLSPVRRQLAGFFQGALQYARRGPPSAHAGFSPELPAPHGHGGGAELGMLFFMALLLAPILQFYSTFTLWLLKTLVLRRVQEGVYPVWGFRMCRFHALCEYEEKHGEAE